MAGDLTSQATLTADAVATARLSAREPGVNMDNGALRRAVALNRSLARLEASGGVTLERVRGIAETGVDYISTSQITMGARPLDLGLDVEIK